MSAVHRGRSIQVSQQVMNSAVHPSQRLLQQEWVHTIDLLLGNEIDTSGANRKEQAKLVVRIGPGHVQDQRRCSGVDPFQDDLRKR
jgi:hypothetical protein